MARSKWEDVKDKLILVEGWARQGLTDEQIAKNLGISKVTFYKYCNEHSELSLLLKKGKEVIDFEVENALLKRALGYEYEEVTQERIIDGGQKQRHENGRIELTEQDWIFAVAYFNDECCYCGSKEKKLTKDHLIPLSKGGQYTRDNIIPCCKRCNSSKHTSDMETWYQSQHFYDKSRLRKIQEYIEFIKRLVIMDENITSRLTVTKVVSKHVVPDTTAQIFWLKNRKPSKWRDKQDIEHSGNIRVSNPYKDLSTEELKRLAALGDENE